MTDAQRRGPNILWTVSEDCPPRFGCYGDALAATPRLDALAERGVLFENAFSPAPVCAPSRFALLTGVAPESNGPAHQMRATAHRPEWMTTYPEALRALGYYCTNNAKTDYNCDVDPRAIWNECSGQGHWRNRPSHDTPFLAVFNIDGTHESSVFGITADAGSTVDPRDVRLPAYLPDTEEIRADFASYYGHVAAMDARVGALLDQLEEDGLADDTIVVHTSDHGGVQPRTKRWCYDEGLHVPLIVAAPPRWAHLFPAPGTRVDAAVCTIRIPPTIVDLAGGTPPAHMQGRSLAGSTFEPDAELAFGMRGRMDARHDLVRTVRDSRFRYIRNYEPHRPYGTHQAFAWLARGYQSWEAEHLAGRLDPVQDAFWHAKPGVELYDTHADPDQIHNLAGDAAYADVEARLRDALRDHLLEVRDNGFLPEASPLNGYEASHSDAYPLERILEVADLVPELDAAHLPRFVAALGDADATVRRWGAIGVLSLGAHGAAAAAEVRKHLGGETDPYVRIPCAEALAHHCSEYCSEAVGIIAELAGPENPALVRLDALNALTAVVESAPEAVDVHRDVVAQAAEETSAFAEYLGTAGRYLLLRIDGTYTPDTVVFDWERLLAAAAQMQRIQST